MVLKNCSVNHPLYYAKLALKKRQVFELLKRLWRKTLIKPFKKIIELITLIKTYIQFLNRARRLYVVEEKLRHSKVQSFNY